MSSFLHQSKRKKLLALLGGGLLVIFLAGSAAQYQKWQTEKKQAANNAVAIEADRLGAAGKFPEARSKLTAEIARTTDEKLKYQLYLSLGNICNEQKDFACSLEAYRNADSLQSSPDTLVAVAESSENLNRKDLALEYYKKALEKFKSGTYQNVESEIEAIEAKIKELGGKND